MADVDWDDAGESGNWGDTINWIGLPIIEDYPGQSLADAVRLGSTIHFGNDAYTVFFNVSTATVGSLEIDGGIGALNSTTLELQGDNSLTVVGSMTFVLNESSAVIDGSGSIVLQGGQVNTQVSPTFTGVTPGPGTFMAGTDTSGGTLDLAGTGSIPSLTSIVFAIGTAAPSTLRFDLAGGVVSTNEITIDNANQTLEIGASGTLTIIPNQNVTSGTIKLSGGVLTDINGISFGSGDLSGSLSGFGTVTGDLTVSLGRIPSIVLATGGNLTLTTAIGADSGLVFDIGDTAASALQLNKAPGLFNDFTFLGSAGELDLTASAASGFIDTITGLDVASTLTPTNLVDILGDTTVTVTLGQIGSGTSGLVELSDGAVLALNGITDASGTWFVNTAPDGDGTGTDVFLSAACYVCGTMIRTPAGERPVETLRPGMQVITRVDGKEVPRAIKWVGHRRIGLTRHPRPETVAPIRIERDAFADNVPHRDLLLSPDHAVFVDGMLICIRQLVNGSTIRTERGWTAVDYYHVELNDHGILLAEGLTVESYLDTGNRGFFANSAAPLTLFPDMTDKTDHPTREVGSCAPFVWNEPSVQPVWQRLAERAAALGQPVQTPATALDPNLCVIVNSRTIRPVCAEFGRLIFVLPTGATEVRLVSRAASPTEAKPWLEDRRRLGVYVERIVQRRDSDVWEVPLDHPRLFRGWWAAERAGAALRRWTNGDAVIPLPASDGPTILEVHVASASLAYPIERAARVA